MAEILKMTEAFSKAREYCVVGLWVNASNLQVVSVGILVGVCRWAWTGLPCEGDFDVLFVNGKAQVEQLELAVVAVEHVPT